MKRFVAFLIICLMLCSCGNGAHGGADTTEAGTTAPVTEPVTEADPLPDAKLTSIYELNPKHEEGSHTDMTQYSALEADYRSRIELSASEQHASKPFYTRVKQLPDGTYLLFYNDEKNGKGVRMLRSEDGVKWSGYTTIFEKSGDKIYANPDALVLNNGDILCCAAYRHSSSYYTNPMSGGIAIKRSTDNGKTWSNEQIIFRGINWEPYMVQLRSGEIQIYWTNTTCHVLPSGNNTSTGTAILRSFDNGHTWTGDPTVAYSGQVVSKQATEKYDGVQFYTDQMPVAVELQNGTIALALESRLDRNNTYRITLSYSKDNWAESIPADGVGPKDKYTNKFTGTAPYIRQFPSGEVLLRFSLSMTSTLLLSDPTGRNFKTDTVALDNMRGWGNIELIDNMHTALVCSTSRYNEGKTNEQHLINIQKVNLNHNVYMQNTTVTVDGNSCEWEAGDALFIGSDSQSQMSVRFARSEKGLGILIDRLDYDITAKDNSTILIALPDNKASYISVTVCPTGVTDGGAIILRDGKRTAIEVECATNVFGTVDNNGDEDEGYVAEILIPSEYLPEEIAVFLKLVNRDEGGKATVDKPDMINESNNTTWFKVLEK